MVRLSERVILQTKIHIPDGQGGFETSWSTVGQYWAEMKFISFGSKENKNEECGKKLAKPYYRLTLRRQVPLKGNMRIKWSGNFYQLVSYPVVDPTKQWISALAQPMESLNV